MPKRANGEGNIYLRADGRWHARISYHDATGALKRQSIYGKTQREVRERLTTVRRALDQGETPITERQTLTVFLNRWLEDVVKPTVRPKTYHSYAQLVRLHLVPGLGQHQLAKVTPQHLQAFLNAKLAAGLSPRTVQYLRAVLRRALGQALKWGLVSRNVATLVDPPRSVRHEMQALSPAQATQLLYAAQGDRLEALYAVAVALGLRMGEVLGLRWCDVDFENSKIQVRVALQRLKGEPPQLVEPKTRQSRRTIALPKVIAAQLRAHRVRQLEEQLKAGGRWQGEQWGLVFPSSIGTPLEPRNLTTRYKALLVRAGLPDLRFHDLRHSCASLLIAQGIPARTIMETLGHSQISLTMDVYGHVFADVQQQAADAMDQLFGVN